ncbi:uncharacterized protein ISCGN_009652 [Ixodes scapularis]
MKKSEISKAISESAEAEDIKIAWELLQNAKSEAAAKEEREQEQAAAKEEREQEQAAAREERAQAAAKEEREQAAAREERAQAAAKEEREQEQAAAREERALKRLELEIEQQRLNSQNSRVGAPVRASEAESYQMKKLLQPFKVGEDVGLFLVNFERTCEKLSFAPETWPQRLLTLLPCEAAEVVARLSTIDADDYDKVVECVCLEQFFRGIPQSVKLWVQDRVGVDSVERAAELAEEYATRRKLNGDDSEPGRSDQRKPFQQGNGSREKRPEKPETGQKVPEKSGDPSSGDPSNGEEARKSQKGQFEARKPFLCYNCQEPGHTAARCNKPRVVFSYVSGSDRDLELLRPYLHELQVNGKPCRVLRDSAATMDVVHPSYVTTSDFTGKVVWIKQLLEKHSVCLPMARVRITGPFGELVTEAAVSQTVPLEYPYLFSNRSDFLLRERGQQLGGGLVQSCTRSKSRQFAPLLTSDPERKAADGEQALPELEAEKRDEGVRVVEQPDLVAPESVRRPNAPAKKAEEDGIIKGSLVAPASRNFGPPLRVDRVSLTVVQKSDPSVSGFRGTAQEIARTNVTGHEKGGLFYRRYKDRIFTSRNHVKIDHYDFSQQALSGRRDSRAEPQQERTWPMHEEGSALRRARRVQVGSSTYLAGPFELYGGKGVRAAVPSDLSASTVRHTPGRSRRGDACQPPCVVRASESLNLNALLAAKAGPRPPFPHSRCPADVTRSIIDRRASLFSSGCRAARRAVSDVSYKSGSRRQRALLGTASPGQNDRLPAAPSHWTST